MSFANSKTMILANGNMGNRDCNKTQISCTTCI